MGEAYRIAAAEAQALAEQNAAVYAANRERLELFERAMGDAMARSRTHPRKDGLPGDDFAQARAEALAAVAEFDRTLPKNVRSRLDALPFSVSYQSS